MKTQTCSQCNAYILPVQTQQCITTTTTTTTNNNNNNKQLPNVDMHGDSSEHVLTIVSLLHHIIYRCQLR